MCLLKYGATLNVKLGEIYEFTLQQNTILKYSLLSYAIFAIDQQVICLKLNKSSIKPTWIIIHNYGLDFSVKLTQFNGSTNFKISRRNLHYSIKL